MLEATMYKMGGGDSGGGTRLGMGTGPLSWKAIAVYVLGLFPRRCCRLGAGESPFKKLDIVRLHGPNLRGLT